MHENWQKYFIGVAVAALLGLYGATCVLRARAWVPGPPFYHYGGTVMGREAVCMGVAYLGGAAYLFARFYLENAVRSTRAENVAYLLQVGALVVFIVGVVLAFRFGLYL